MPTIGLTVEKLTLAGVRTVEFRNTLAMAVQEAESCDIGALLVEMMAIDEEVSLIHRQLDQIELRQHADVSAARHMTFDLADQSIEEIMAILKAKQCKCG